MFNFDEEDFYEGEIEFRSKLLENGSNLEEVNNKIFKEFYYDFRVV